MNHTVCRVLFRHPSNIIIANYKHEDETSREEWGLCFEEMFSRTVGLPDPSHRRLGWRYRHLVGRPHHLVQTPASPVRSIRKLRIRWLRISESRFRFLGTSPVDLGIPPLRIKNMLESKPLKSRFSVRELALTHVHAIQDIPSASFARSSLHAFNHLYLCQ